jgi:hypothetical protein
MFNYKGLLISFTVEVESINESVITVTVPDVLYKSLNRSNARVAVPPELGIRLMSLDDRYSLPFPKAPKFEAVDESAILPNIDPKNFNAIIEHLAAAVNKCADGYKLTYFSATVAPETTEERLISENGTILFIPSFNEEFPVIKPEQQNIMISAELFKRYFESIGVASAFLNQQLEQYLKDKYAEKIASAVWVPLLFCEYVVGYIYAWKKESDTDEENRKDNVLDPAFVEKLRHYARCLILSLRDREYFEAGRTKDRVINGKVVDISASGLRFVVPNSFIFLTLQPDTEIAVRLYTSDHTIDTKIKVRRRYKEGRLVNIGCSFMDMAPDDAKFLFDFIYGQPADDTSKEFHAGNV